MYETKFKQKHSTTVVISQQVGDHWNWFCPVWDTSPCTHWHPDTRLPLLKGNGLHGNMRALFWMKFHFSNKTNWLKSNVQWKHFLYSDHEGYTQLREKKKYSFKLSSNTAYEHELHLHIYELTSFLKGRESEGIVGQGLQEIRNVAPVSKQHLFRCWHDDWLLQLQPDECSWMRIAQWC